MAYPRARGENPLNYDEYDPTPFSGGYDQVALYGRPKSPSAETCYPISECSHHESGVYGVDEDRPSFQHEDPPHGSADYSYSSYEEEGAGYGSGYGRPKPSSYEEGGGGYGSGHGRSGYEEDCGSGHGPSSYEEEGGKGYGSPFGEGELEFGSGHEEGYGRPRPQPGYGGGGFGRPHGEEGYGGFFDEKPHDSFGYGGRKPSGFEGEEGGFGGLWPPLFGGEEGRFGEGEEGGFGGGGFQSSYFGGEPPAPPADEGSGDYHGEEHRHGHGHHHKHHWRHDDE